MLEDAGNVALQTSGGMPQLVGEGVSVRLLPGLSQYVVSGNLQAFTNRHDLGEPVDLLGQARGDRYAVRLSRDRMLVVGLADAELVPGWNDEGYAVSDMSSALQVCELAGPAWMEIVRRGCTLDPGGSSPSAAAPFAGVASCLYRHGDAQTIRLHVDRGLMHFIWSWMRAQSSLRDDVRQLGQP